MLRRAMGTELGIGLVVMAVTAAMVVSPPASARHEATAVPPTTTIAPVSSSLAAVPSTAAAVPTAATTPSACTISTTLRLGMSGIGVQCLQRTLVAKGFLRGEPPETFDAATEVAVRAAQTSAGLAVDGVVGPQTAGSLGIWKAP